MVEQTRYNTNECKKKLLPMTAIEFVENPEPRCACVLLLDCSGSMAGENIRALNNGIKELKRQLENDDIASKRVEIAVVRFASSVDVINDFSTVDDFNPVELEAGGTTMMTEAIEIATNMIEERKNDYKQNSISYYRPWIFLITDGGPTNEEGYLLEDRDPRLIKAIKILHNGVNSKQFTFYAVGVDNADMDTLAKLSPVSVPLKLKENKWNEMFTWLSSSLVSLSSSSMDTKRVKLPSPVGWGYEDL